MSRTRRAAAKLRLQETDDDHRRVLAVITFLRPSLHRLRPEVAHPTTRETLTLEQFAQLRRSPGHRRR
jgi:hypothetical protein